MDDKKKLAQLSNWLQTSKQIVFFGGAGVSTESGIPDFRSAGGLYQPPAAAGTLSPETLLSVNYFTSQPAAFFAFYFQHMLYPAAQPNPAHRALSALEAEGRMLAVITQNIDGLHQAAGSANVLELHGSIHRNYCVLCHQPYTLAQMRDLRDRDGIPRCSCGGIVRPDVVLYGEGLNDQVWRQAIAAIHAADLLIVGGTSLTVFPAAGLVDGYRGKRMVIVNRDPTPFDRRADLLLHAPIGKVFAQLV